MNDLALAILVVIVLIILNGIFSAGEFAIISSRKSKIKNLIKTGDDKRARTLLELRENPDKFLPTVQIGITLFGSLASAIGGSISVTYVEPLIKG